MKVGIIGSGGREHAICFALKKSKKIKHIYCFPGNAGTSQIAENVSINVEDFNELKNFIQVCPKEMLDKLDNPLTLKKTIKEVS